MLDINHLACRQNQELEQATLVIQQEKQQLEQKAQSLAQQLQAVLQDKFVPQTAFDADTPIDKTLKLLQSIIGVWSYCLMPCTGRSVMLVQA